MTINQPPRVIIHFVTELGSRVAGTRGHTNPHTILVGWSPRNGVADPQGEIAYDPEAAMLWHGCGQAAHPVGILCPAAASALRTLLPPVRGAARHGAWRSAWILAARAAITAPHALAYPA